MREILLLVGIILLTAKRTMGFSIKEGVYGTLRHEMDPALNAVQAVWALNRLGYPVITSIKDGAHMAQSKHYEGLAFDIRLNNIAPGLHDVLREQVQNVAGDDFDVVHKAENHGQPHDHLHIEYDPN